MNINKPTKRIKICHYCIGLFPELRSVFQSKQIKNDFASSMCLNHFKEHLMGVKPKNRKSVFDRIDKQMNHDWPPDLREHPELVKAYSQGNFTTENIQEKIFEHVEDNKFKLKK